MNSTIVYQISSHLGKKLVVLEQLPARHGTSCKLEDSDGTKILLKLVDTAPDDPVTLRRKRSLLQEARLLEELPAITGNLYLDHGELNTTTWLLRRWIAGVTTLEHCSYVHTRPLTPELKRRFVSDLCHMLGVVMRLDAVGYLHGDLQPRHFLVDQEGTFHLIDLELAVHKGDAGADYGGGLVHYVSPEVARAMLTGDQHIPLDARSEIYSFAAVAFTLYTRKTATRYESAVPGEQGRELSFAQQLQAIGQRPIRSFVEAGAEPFPELERVLQWCLETNREHRCPTFDAVLHALEHLL